MGLLSKAQEYVPKGLLKKATEYLERAERFEQESLRLYRNQLREDNSREVNGPYDDSTPFELL